MRRSHTLQAVLNQKGATVAEMVVTIALAAVLSGLSVLSLKPNFLDVSTARQNLVNDLRKARMQASLRGVHYRVLLGADDYRIERMQDNDRDGSWQVDTSFDPQQVSLPSTLSLAVYGPTAGVSGIEFNTRGMIAPPQQGNLLSVVTLKIIDNDGTASPPVEVWPSGQILDSIHAQEAA